MLILKTLIVGIALATIVSAAPTPEEQTDCVHSADWTISIINKKTYWAAIPKNGQPTDLSNAQCLAMEGRTCTPCTLIIANYLGIRAEFLPCTIWFSPLSKRDMESSLEGNETILIESRQVNVQRVAIDPPKPIYAIECG